MSRVKLPYTKPVSMAHIYNNLSLSELTITKCAEHKCSTTSLCMSKNEKFIYSTSKDGALIKWSVDKKHENTCTLFAKKKVCCLAISPNNKFLAVGVGSEINMCEPWSLKCIKVLDGHRDVVTGVVFSKDSAFLYSTGIDKLVKVYTMENICLVETLYGHTADVMSIDFMFLETVVTCANDGSIRVWKIEEETHLIFNAHTINICCVRGLDEQHFISGSQDGKLSVWSLHKKKPFCYVVSAHGCNPLNSEPYWIVSVACLCGTDLIASGSYDGFIRMWKLEETKQKISCVFTIPMKGYVNDLIFADEGKCIIALIGKEHKLGRWSMIKEAKNNVNIINFGLNLIVDNVLVIMHLLSN